MQKLETLADIGAYHLDAELALRAFYSKSAGGDYHVKFVAYSETQVNKELVYRISETELRSIFIILARVEAAFRRDYEVRVDAKKPDSISTAFRRLHAVKGGHVSLPDDILKVWKDNLEPADRANISAYKGMLHTRHWLAHGRHWVHRVPFKYLDVYVLADALLNQLPFER